MCTLPLRRADFSNHVRPRPQGVQKGQPMNSDESGNDILPYSFSRISPTRHKFSNLLDEYTHTDSRPEFCFGWLLGVMPLTVLMMRRESCAVAL